jgi:3-carboxy-cis,cis-muconate cycloisomerase
MPGRILALAASTPDMLAVFGDAALVGHALAFEAALAGALAAEGVIPAGAADAIRAACAEPDFEVAELAAAAAHAGAFAIPLVAELRRGVAGRDPAAAEAVHRGATSQDVADTALMRQAQRAVALLARDGARIVDALGALADRHAGTPMLARTLLQPAATTTFGLKAAQWRQGVVDALARVAHEAERAIRLQFGGAVGTRAGLAGCGDAVAARMAAELGLPAAEPWHGRRDAVAGLGAAVAILAAATGKIARDVALMAQGEVGEAFEPPEPGRGGSSAMPHKRNPTGCQVALSAAGRAPHLAATLIAAVPGEHERALGGWQAEAPVLAELFEVTHGAVAAMATVAEGLELDVEAMARNLAQARVGDDTGEAAALARRLLQPGAP